MLTLEPRGPRRAPSVRERDLEPAGADPRRLPDEEFSALVTPHFDLMARVARRILPSDDLAWDAVQETLLRVWLRGSLPEDPKPVLVHLVVRSALHVRRCLRRRRDHEELSAGVGSCCYDDPAAALRDREVEQDLRRRLERIAAGPRAVFELYELEGLDYGQVARRLAIPVGTVRSRLARARSLLRASLGADVGVEAA